ncbi:MAG: hypothetical protein KA482_10870 [Sphingobium sp.]|nr:hypothetical protein [Sphingobium sp.]MBP8671458.1 hypothetical protein [Sphingobium sp.]MBP9158564.1 hypothetical protein [Sphingobium sp.]MCC6481970.1 hypothetical protein [Sphingomonadaceae bacterium]
MNRPLFPSDFTVGATALDARRSPWIERGHNALWLVGALWLECTVVWLAWHWASFAHLEFRDPDDVMRLVQVRNFLAGQSWFDVSMHRINPPVGGPMHWSRLIDLPIAGIILAMRPFFGNPLAEVIACVAVPPLTLAAMCLAVYAALKRLLGVHRTLLVVALLVTSFPILTQMAPLRIDHHAWQVVASVGVLGGILARYPRLGGWLAGASMAIWLHVSGEALPYVVINGAVLGMRYMVRPHAEWARLIRFVAALTVGSAALLLATHGWAASLETHCDSMSPPYLLPLVTVLVSLWAGHRLLGEATLARRLAPLGMSALAGACVLVSYAPQCLSGPFQALDPLVYDYWYLAIAEGQPVWKQDLSTVAIILLPALLGLGGMIGAVLSEKDADRRFDWLSILGMALGAFAVSILVLRAMGVAHLLMLVGNMWIIARLYPHIAAMKHMLARVGLTASLCVLTPFGSAALSSTAISVISHTPDDIKSGRKQPHVYRQIEALRALPRSVLFTSLDMGPEILLRTRHSVIATSHHRNIVGMTEVIHGFTAPPGKDKAIILATPAHYLLLFPEGNEIKRYSSKAPNGLAARLIKGQVPDWLAQVHVKGGDPTRIYRIVR